MFRKLFRSFRNRRFLTKPFLKKKLGGVTIIEIIVVMAIIILLLGIAFVLTGGSRAQARDTKRVNEINSMRTALKLYHMDYAKYPESEVEGEWCSIEDQCLNLREEIEPYMVQIPSDPIFGLGKEDVDQLFSYQYQTVDSGEGYRKR